ncbi:MAG: hypothetical protein GX197_00555 [Firmicutes bacterium]|nr:hypothetical protein [Bacillota bacterium]
MTSLRSRLLRLRNSGEIQTAAKIVPTRKIHFSLFPGEEVYAHTPAGPCYYRELRFPLTKKHGNGLLQEILDFKGKGFILATQDETLEKLRPQDLLFLDTETTGLAGGTGTWVILIGLGWCQDDCFYLRQYFLPNPAAEKAMLLHFYHTAQKFPGVITFNGKTFDLPLIQTRLVLNGIAEKFTPAYHLDLLTCSRRLWKDRLLSCSLQSLEKEILAFQRQHDIPGSLVPAIYFSYLRTGRMDQIRSVFTHNVWDILSMVRLLTVVAQAARTPLHTADYFALGKLHCAQNRFQEAVFCFRQASRCGLPRLEQDALLQLSFIYKRQRKWQEAAAAWQELINIYPANLTAYLELAKYYEHRRKNYTAALTLTEYILKRVKAQPDAACSGQLLPAALEHRKTRLQKKAGLTPHGCRQ